MPRASVRIAVRAKAGLLRSARAAKVIVWYQVDGGHVCPISMTYSVIPSLRHVPEIAADGVFVNDALSRRIHWSGPTVAP